MKIIQQEIIDRALVTPEKPPSGVYGNSPISFGGGAVLPQIKLEPPDLDKILI